MSRREFLQQTAAFATMPFAVPAKIRAIDTHTHFYDPTRPQGVPWPQPAETLLYRPYYPKEFVALTEPLGVVGTVVVEASPWLEDNQWILDLAADNPSIVGFIGNLKLGVPEFAANLQRFTRNPLFRGLRIGERVLTEGLGQRAFERDLQRLGEQRLTIDVIGGATLLPQIQRVAKLAPKLKMVIDHLPFAAWDRKAEAMRTALAQVAALPQVFAKVSNVVRRNDGRVIEDAAFYRPHLDVLWQLFGARRLVFGSNWPVSERVAPYATVHRVVAEYFTAKGKATAENYFWKNSRAAYGWQARGASKILGKTLGR
jgi:predicted TIM-barrel fold metal-dependent hydrolase